MTHEAIAKNELIAFFERCHTNVIRGLREDIFSEIKDEQTRKIGRSLQFRSANALSSFVQWHGVAEELSRAHRMLGRYPWHGTEITKTQHLETTWFLIQNLCYHFKEKTKLFFNQQKAASKALNLAEPNWLKNQLSFIERQMGEAIRDRGNTVHGWNSRIQATYSLSAVEILQAEDGATKDWDLKGHYEDAKFELRHDAEAYRECAFKVLNDCFFYHEPTPNQIVLRYNEVCDAVFSDGARLVAKENT